MLICCTDKPKAIEYFGYMPRTTIKRSSENTDQLLVRFNKLTTRFVKSRRAGNAFQRSPSRLKMRIAALKREHYRAARRQRQFYV